MIEVQLLGGACLRSDGEVLAGPPAQRHRIALLTLLAASWPQPLTRDRALALLWPERDTAGGRRLLNLAVHVLRSTLGEQAIVSAGDGLVFEPSGVRCDLCDLRAAVMADDPDGIVRCYAGPLLDGFHLPESAEFDIWLAAQRDELSRAYQRALLSVAERQAREGDVHGRGATCRRLVAADPHSSVHVRELMRALDAAGDRAGAIQAAADHAQRLRADLDLEPAPDVVAFAERLRRMPAEHRPSVAVLPFIALNASAEDEFFTDGMTEDVIAHLSKVRTLKVIARNSVMPFRSRAEPLSAIARTLGVGTVLDGTVRRVGDRVRIVAALVDVETDQQLWTETYDRELTDIFAIQADVALQIARALESELSSDERQRITRKPTDDLEAYRHYLQGRRWRTKYTSEAIKKAVECFTRALEHDPSFAEAHADIAIAYIELAEQGATDPVAVSAKAAEAAEEALRLDPHLGDAHGVMGYLKMVREFDWVAAEEGLRRALELNPNSADAYDLYGRFCGSLERYDEGIALLQRGQELDPLAHRVDLATMYLRAGRLGEALPRAEEAAETDPTSPRAQATLGWAYLLSGREADGLARLERAVAISGSASIWLSQLGQALATAGRGEEARAILAALEERARTGFVSPYHLAYVHTGLGELDRALDLLERAMAARSGTTYSIKGSFLFRALHGHPRWRVLLARMNLEPREEG